MSDSVGFRLDKSRLGQGVGLSLRRIKNMLLSIHYIPVTSFFHFFFLKHPNKNKTMSPFCIPKVL